MVEIFEATRHMHDFFHLPCPADVFFPRCTFNLLTQTHTLLRTHSQFPQIFSPHFITVHPNIPIFSLLSHATPRKMLKRNGNEKLNTSEIDQRIGFSQHKSNQKKKNPKKHQSVQRWLCQSPVFHLIHSLSPLTSVSSSAHIPSTLPLPFYLHSFFSILSLPLVLPRPPISQLLSSPFIPPSLL